MKRYTSQTTVKSLALQNVWNEIYSDATHVQNFYTKLLVHVCCDIFIANKQLHIRTIVHYTQTI
jgi:hypothetical protein